MEYPSVAFLQCSVLLSFQLRTLMSYMIKQAQATVPLLLECLRLLSLDFRHKAGLRLA